MAQIRLHPSELYKLQRWVEENLGEVEPLPWYNPSPAQLEYDRDAGHVFVFEGGAPLEDTIFFDGVDPEYRHFMHCYRAWHDSLHLEFGLPFTEDAELELASIQQFKAENELGFSEFGAYLLRLDLELHIKHYWKHKQHPNKQVQMIGCALQYGQDFAMRRAWV